MPLSFLELQESQTTTKDQLVATLAYYAKSGAAITAKVVIELIDRVRCEFTENDIDEIRKWAKIGMSGQAQMQLLLEAREYRKVAEYV